MTSSALAYLPRPDRMTREQIERRLKTCARLPSLSSINSALRELLNADQRYTTQVAEIIRRDPSLTSRLLRLVNSVYYGLSTPVNNIEEAVFYLGVRHIRQLVMVTPVIEDFQKLTGGARFKWREFWQHCIGSAILSREVIGLVQAPNDEVDYVAGLVHDVGKIAMAATFPEHFEAIYCGDESDSRELREIERDILGLDHTELGAMYLKNHNLPDVLVEVARYHHEPDRAAQYAPMVSAVQVADFLLRQARIGYSGQRQPVADQAWQQCAGWKILFEQRSEQEQAIARASLTGSLGRLPTILEGLV